VCVDPFAVTIDNRDDHVHDGDGTRRILPWSGPVGISSLLKRPQRHDRGAFSSTAYAAVVVTTTLGLAVRGKPSVGTAS
jgi:hypothetical protein